MRALTEEERYKRKDRLAEAGLELFAERGWQALTIEAIASRAGVAKGTVFLSFSTKEELFLHGLRGRFDAWFGRLSAVDPASGNTREWAEQTLRTLREDPQFLPLLSLTGPVLERGAARDAVLEFKMALAQGLHRLSSIWGPKLPKVGPETWPALFLRVYAIIIGAWTVGEPAASVRSAIEASPELALFGLGFDALFVPVLEAQLDAALADEKPLKVSAGGVPVQVAPGTGRQGMPRDMRRSDRKTSPQEARELLRAGQFGVLSTVSPDGEPYGIPVNYVFLDDSICFHCALEGRKLDNLTENNRVSFCVIGATELLPAQFSTRYESAIVTGTAHELTGDAKRRVLLALLEKYSPRYIEEGLQEIDATGDRTRVVRVAVDSISGKARR